MALVFLKEECNYLYTLQPCPMKEINLKKEKQIQIPQSLFVSLVKFFLLEVDTIIMTSGGLRDDITTFWDKKNSLVITKN